MFLIDLVSFNDDQKIKTTNHLTATHSFKDESEIEIEQIDSTETEKKIITVM